MSRRHTIPPLRYTTLVLVVVFLLIKLSPQYFAWQYLPARHAETVARTFSCTLSTHQILVVVDKSIVEKRGHTALPAPKWTDILPATSRARVVGASVTQVQQRFICLFPWSNMRLAHLGVFRL